VARIAAARQKAEAQRTITALNLRIAGMAWGFILDSGAFYPLEEMQGCRSELFAAHPSVWPE
jgi:hypothetical protein